MEREKGEVVGRELGEEQEKWVYDSSIDHKGRLPLRASTGVWIAALFIISKTFIYFFLSIFVMLIN